MGQITSFAVLLCLLQLLAAGGALKIYCLLILCCSSLQNGPEKYNRSLPFVLVNRVMKRSKKRPRYCLRLSFHEVPFSLASWSKADKQTICHQSFLTGSQGSKAKLQTAFVGRIIELAALEINICKHMGKKWEKKTINNTSQKQNQSRDESRWMFTQII